MSLSFIVPVNNESQYKVFEDSIKDFKDYETIPIRGADSIFDAWRKGIEQAKNKYLVFTHQDVSYLEALPDLDKIFSDPNVGMVGVAGATYILKDKPWWWAGAEVFGSGKMYHDGCLCNNTRSGEWYLDLYGECGEVVILDGVCLITTKDRIDAIGGIPNKDYGKWDMYDHIFSSEFIKHGFKLLTIPIKMVHHTGCSLRKTFSDDVTKFANEYIWRD